MVLRSHRAIFGRIDHGILAHISFVRPGRSEEWDAQKGPLNGDFDEAERLALAFRPAQFAPSPTWSREIFRVGLRSRSLSIVNTTQY
jgi:hypothetical protein